MKTQIQLTNFKFFTPIHIRWNDLDPLRHVNNVHYIDYFQNGRGKYINEVCKKWDWRINLFVIANINCDYWKEMQFIAVNPQIGVRVSNVGSKSFVMEYVIISTGDNNEPIIHASGSSTQVLVDTKSGKSTEIPDWIRNNFNKYEPAL